MKGADRCFGTGEQSPGTPFPSCTGRDTWYKWRRPKLGTQQQEAFGKGQELSLGTRSASSPSTTDRENYDTLRTSGTSLDYEAGRPGFDSRSYPNKSEHAPRRCTLGKGENEYLALARDVPRIGRKMEVPCLGESHPTHIKEPTALIEKSRGPSRCEWFKPYSLAVEQGDEEKVVAELGKKASPGKMGPEGTSAFHLAASKGQLECLDIMVAHGIDLMVTDTAGRTALHSAARGGSAECVERLLQNKLPVSSEDTDGMSPLHHAAAGGHISAALVLLQYQAAINAQDKEGKAPMMHAASVGHVNMVKLLLLVDQGADMNAQDGVTNSTALMQACERGNTEVVELLVRKGAKVDLQDVLGQTATDYAKSAGHNELLSVLEMAPSTATWDIDDYAKSAGHSELLSVLEMAPSTATWDIDAAAGKQLGLIISVPKTEYMTYNCSPQLPLEVYGQPIRHVANFKYLGSMMASSSHDMAKRKSLAWTAFWKLEKIWRSPSISTSTKLKLFNTTCVTILLYGCESWVITGDMENKLNAFATSCYRVMLNIKRLDHVSNAWIYKLTNTRPLITMVRQRQLRFLGHALRMPVGQPCRTYALYVPTHGKRRPGRQRLDYLGYVRNLLGDTEGDLRPEDIANLAADRQSWGRLVVDCSAAGR
ncbi:spermatogenesis [Branchiostoma belcheri]|nr:spermatogenesis [Branchiostoma belcheri]